jgi:hypothetical protein
MTSLSDDASDVLSCFRRKYDSLWYVLLAIIIGWTITITLTCLMWYDPPWFLKQQPQQPVTFWRAYDFVATIQWFLVPVYVILILRPASSSSSSSCVV